MQYLKKFSLVGIALLALLALAAGPAAAQKRPNVVMLMSDDVGWGDYGVYHGGAALGHPTPNIDRLAKEGAMFTSWYGQASCTAGRASFMTGRIPIRSALSVVVVPGDPNGLDADTPTIAEFYKKNGYQTYFSGKWHLGDVEKFYPINHGFDEMKQFAAYYPGVYGYSDTSPNAHPWFPKFNAEYWKMYQSVVNLYEWEGTAGKPAVKGNNGAVITLENLADFDVRQTDSAVAYIKQHAKDGKPFFMNVNFMGMHQPTSPNKAFQGKSRLGNYSDKMLEMDAQHRPHHGRYPGRGAGHHRHPHGGQWRLAGRLARRRHQPVPRRKGFTVRGRLGASRASCGRRVRFRRGLCSTK